MLLRLLVSFLAPAAALVVPVHERNDDVVLGNWIVQLKCGIDPSTIQAHHVTARAIHQRNSKRHDGGIKKTFKVRDFNAYSGTFDEATAAEIASLPEVLAVTRDGVKYISGAYCAVRVVTVEEPLNADEKPPAAYEKPSTANEKPPTASETNPPPYGTNPPAYGENPPAYEENPPAYGSNLPAYGTNPPPYGTNPTDETTPPAYATTSAPIYSTLTTTTYPAYPTTKPYTNGTTTTPPTNGTTTTPPTTGATTPPTNGTTTPPKNVTLDLLTQDPAPWALGSISHREPGSTEYIYDSTAGEGTYVYVLDTGIRLTHVDFEGRASFGYNAVGGTNEPLIEHGTSIASFAVGKTYGVAKKAHVIDVNVFGDSSATSDSIILDGFNWAVDDIIANNRVNVSVINMSLGGARTANSPWDAAIQNAFDLGILVVVAAGNENLNASTRSPASSPAALTVGNIDKTNVRNNESPSFGSNYGPAVKIFAPGTAVTGASLQSDTAVIDTTGTSDASPHVAGLACYLRGLYGPSSAKDITQQILELATKDVVVDPKGSANLLAYNGSGR